MSLERVPFYRQRLAGGRPRPWDLEDVVEFARHWGDPAGGRLMEGERPLLWLQLEVPDEPSLYLPLAREELRGWARALIYAWRLWGVERGQLIALYDYGSSPMVFLASGAYTPHLSVGAADVLGVVPVCNDGLASMASRMVEVLRYAHPQALVARADVLVPLAQAAAQAGLEVSRHLAWVAVTEAEGVPQASPPWAVPTWRTWRADAALFLAAECPECRLFHVPPRLYRLDRGPQGTVVVDALFPRICPVVGYRLGPATLVGPGCQREPMAWRLAPC
ncbi:MAG: hypothetical protein RQ985_08965 [Dehalococcoidia bacterium]|jgi:hypothetical protein|nr:hypothetical protein [Dehalococcoidia bacterium]